MTDRRIWVGRLKARLSEYLRRLSGRLDRAYLDLRRPKDPEGRSLEAVLEERAEGW